VRSAGSIASNLTAGFLFAFGIAIFFTLLVAIAITFLLITLSFAKNKR
jgi:hypothetical protein